MLTSPNASSKFSAAKLILGIRFRQKHSSIRIVITFFIVFPPCIEFQIMFHKIFLRNKKELTIGKL